MDSANGGIGLLIDDARARLKEFLHRLTEYDIPLDDLQAAGDSIRIGGLDRRQICIVQGQLRLLQQDFKSEVRQLNMHLEDDYLAEYKDYLAGRKPSPFLGMIRDGAILISVDARNNRG